MKTNGLVGPIPLQTATILRRNPGIFRRRFVALVILVMSLIVLPFMANAQESQCEVERNARTRAMDEMSWNQLNRINEMVFEQQYDEARVALDRLLQRAGRDDYLRAIVYQVLAQVAWATEEYETSLSYFEQAVELDVLPDDAHFSLMLQLAQLYFMQERYPEALERLEIWFCKAAVERIDAGAWVLKASIYSRMNDYRLALDSIETAISLSSEPNETWYQLKLAAHYELEEYSQAAATLEEMIVRWPSKKRYWVQLSQIRFRLMEPERALAVMALAYRNNLLDSESDLSWLASLYSQADIPFKAALIMEKGIIDGVLSPNADHWLIVADSWYRAEEMDRALQAYQKAGGLSADGKTDLRRAYILVDLERWDDALLALNAALEKGGVDERREAEAFLLRGLVHFNLGELDRAGSDWARASRNEKNREAAQQWLNHLREERRKQNS